MLLGCGAGEQGPADQGPAVQGAGNAGSAPQGVAAVTAAEDSRQGGDPPEILATINGEPVTLAAVDEVAQPQLDQIRRQLFDVRKATLEQMIDETLLEAEAAKRSINIEHLFVEEIEAKTTPPSPNVVAEFYEKNRADMEDSLDEMMPQLTDYLLQQKRHERMGVFLKELRMAAKVEIFLKLARVEVAAGDAARKGPQDAPVEIIEFSDFQCPFCTRGAGVVAEIVGHYGDRVSIVFKHFPLEFHPEAHGAAQAAECARDQGKFWEYHDILFANQEKLFPPDLVEHALQLDLDADIFEACLQSQKYAGRVNADLTEGGAIGMSGTPGFYINGIPLSGAQPFENFKLIIDEELASK
jgi:predicted DsbA family dithiol-disulfide isomerase